MSPDDSVTERIVDGTSYDEAKLTVRRTFPGCLADKIRAAVCILAASGLLAPAISLAPDRTRSVGGAGASPGTGSPTIAVLTLVGIIVTFGAGLYLTYQRHLTSRRSLSDPEARRLVRTADMMTWFVVQGGALVLIPAAMAVVGAAAPEVVDTLGGYGVEVYRHSRTGGVGTRRVSALGVGLAVVLYTVYRAVPRLSA
jgi:hypothetical protein